MIHFKEGRECFWKMRFMSGLKISRIQGICILLILGAAACISILAWVPPVSRDALTHHLAVPKLYLQHGGIYEIPHLSFSYYPMNLDLLYLIPLYFNNDILPKFIHFVFAIATAVLICWYLARRINLTYGLLGGLFFLTIPVIVRLSSTVYVDLGLIFFLFTSLLCLFRWIETGFKPGYLIAGAVFCGLALGTKYNGLVGLFLLALFAAFVYARYNAGHKFAGFKAAGWCAVFITIALLVFSPWMIRNVAWTGNPVYPLYNSVFESVADSEKTGPENDEERPARVSHIQFRRLAYNESWAEIALIPLRVFFQGEDDNPRYFDGRTSPFLLILSVFAFWGIRTAGRQMKTEKFMMLFFAVLFLLYACVKTSIRIRYFSPIIPPLVILSMYGLHNLQSAIQDRIPGLPEWTKKTVILIIVFAMLGTNAAYMAERFNKDQPLAYITGQFTRDQYIQKFRPEYASFEYANKNLAENDKIFGLFLGNRGYYSDIPIEFGNDLLQWSAPGPEKGSGIAKAMRKNGFTHLLINFNMFNHSIKEKTIREKKIFKEFLDNYTVKKFAKHGYGLLQITSDPKSG